MTNELQQAMEAKAAAAQALADAEKHVREIALANYGAARDAALAAGVKLPPLARAGTERRRSAEAVEKMRAAAHRTWANKTPEERAAWVAAIGKGRSAARNGATVQGVQ